MEERWGDPKMQKHDGAQALATASGLPKPEVLSLWEKAKANSRTLDPCPRHSFSGPAKVGQRVTCKACGGELQLIEIGMYIRGYEAAGGDANDIWPGWRGHATARKDGK